MTAASATTGRVLVVDGDDRVRRALAELISSTDGFTVVATEGPKRRNTSAAGATVAVVVLASAADRAGLARIRELTDRMPVLAVSAAGSAASAAAAAGATAFCEMDGNADELIAALHTACRSRSNR